MKKFLSILLSGALLLGCLAGCGSSSGSGASADSSAASDSGTGLIGVCMQNMSSSISELEATALQNMFGPMGYDVQVVSADDSVSNQLQQIQNFVLMKAKMIVVLPCEITTLADVLTEAKDAGIKVVISGGTGSISEDCYDAASSDDEYMIGMYVAGIAKAWIEQNMDPSGSWDVAFLSSTISDDAKDRCQGEFQIIEPYLKNIDGQYIDLRGNVVDEANRIANPVYCDMVAKRVESLTSSCTEMDISGDNRSVVAGVLTDNPNVRVIIGYNSLVSTAGSQYVMDTYSADQLSQFAFFSAGVMGDEYEYLIGSVTNAAGTPSVFRGACQFGGGDAAATLANLCNSVMFGQAGVDYGKSNPNSIGLYYPISSDLNSGNPELVFFDTPSYVEYYTLKDVVKNSGKTVYWDAANGYNAEAKANAAPAPAAPAASSASLTGGKAYTAVTKGMAGDETVEFDLMDDGTCQFYLPGNAMITDKYAGTYTIAADGVTVTITGLKNVDASSPYPVPGLWSFIDSATGNSTITINADGTFTPAQ